MKKRIISVLLIMTMLFSFSPVIASYASLETTHTHCVCSRDGGYEFIRVGSHSHYGSRNGREDWWPCIIYDKYKITERYCVDCGMVIESLCYRDYVGKVHEWAY